MLVTKKQRVSAARFNLFLGLGVLNFFEQSQNNSNCLMTQEMLEIVIDN